MEISALVPIYSSCGQLKHERMDKYQELTKLGKDKYLQKVKSINWHDSDETILQAIIESINETSDDSYLVYALGVLGFDGEGFESASDYENILNEINELLKDQKLNVNVENQSGLLKIELKKNKTNVYEIDIEETGGWISEGFMEFINRTLKDEGFEEQFYALPPSDQTVDFIFSTEEKYKKAIDEGFIPEEMGYFFENR
jgi:hypothetical protein